MVSWIKMELGRVFPEANLEKGVDFDASGTLEPWEEIRDDDGDGVTGSVDDWEYLYARNQEFARLQGGLLERADALGMDSYGSAELGFEAYVVSEESSDRAAFFVEGVVERFRQEQREGTLLTSAKILEMMPTVVQAVGLKKTKSGGRHASELLARGEVTGETFGFLELAVRGALGVDNTLSEEGKYEYESTLSNIRVSVATLCFLNGRYHETVNLLSGDVDWTAYANAHKMFLLRARARTKLGQYDKALIDFAHAEEFQPTDGSFYFYYGQLYEAQGNDKAALTEYRKARLLGLKSQELDIAFGNSSFRTEDYFGAAMHFHAARTQGAAGSDFYYKFGVSLLETSDSPTRTFRKTRTAEAVGYFDRAIEGDDSKPEYFKARGHAYAKLGAYDKARADFKLALALDPENFQIARELLVDAHSRYDWEGVIRYAEVMFKTDPANVEARQYYGVALMLLDQDTEGAIEGFDAVLKENPESVITYVSRAIARLANGDIDGALMDIAQAKRREVNPLFYLAVEAQCYIKRQQYARAVEAYKKLIRHEPKEKRKASNFIQLGNTYVDWGKYRMALKCFKKAHELDPSSEDAPVLYHETMRKVEW